LASGTEEPIFPRKLFRLVEFVDEVHQEGGVLSLEVPDPEATFLHRQTNLVPSNKAARAGASILARPKEGAPSLVNSINHTRWQKKGAHKISSKVIQDSVA
jgi:hypothetical protein